jgi:hypothetical protein
MVIINLLYVPFEIDADEKIVFRINLVPGLVRIPGYQFQFGCLTSVCHDNIQLSVLLPGTIIR